MIALGTNDAFNASRYRDLVANAVRHVNPVAQLIWVLPHRWHPAMDAIRAATLEALRQRPRTTILDDDLQWTQHPEHRASDGVHLNASGYAYRASILAAATVDVLGAVAGFAARVGSGYWTVKGTGVITGFDGAQQLGDAAAMPLNRPIVGMTSTPTGAGYWLVAADGGIFSFGDAVFHGSLGSALLNKPILSMASTPTGAGYWLVAADGGVSSFGDAVFKGSLGGATLPSPVTTMAAAPTGDGYWLATSDGAVFAFGNANHHGSAAGTPLNGPVVGITPSEAGHGYWLVATDGGVFTYGPPQPPSTAPPAPTSRRRRSSDSPPDAPEASATSSSPKTGTPTSSAPEQEAGIPREREEVPSWRSVTISPAKNVRVRHHRSVR